MNFNNPIHKSIYQKVVVPSMNMKAQDVEGTVIACDYFAQTVDVYWKNPVSLAERYVYGMALPKDGDGIFRQSVRNGDKVRIAFRNGHYSDPYISVVEKSQGNQISFEARYGANIPRGMGYL